MKTSHLGNLYFTDHTLEFSFWWDGAPSADAQYLYGSNGDLGKGKEGSAEMPGVHGILRVGTVPGLFDASPASPFPRIAVSICGAPRGRAVHLDNLTIPFDFSTRMRSASPFPDFAVLRLETILRSCSSSRH